MSSSPISSTAGTDPGKASAPLISADVAAQVKQALAPVTAGVAQLNTALAAGQAKLSGLGQLKSAIADFQTLAASLTGKTAASAGSAPASDDPAAKLRSFVAGFNALNSKLQSLQQGNLKADPALAQVSSQLAQMVRDSGPGSAGGALAKAGISVDASGAMKLDEKKLSAALASDPAGVAGLLLPGGRGPVDTLSSRLGSYTTDNGPVAREAASTSHAVSVLETKKTTMTKALTAQATALAAFYTQQANSSSASGTPGSLFDMLA
jgi:flagellar hook-associated protein 2